MLLDVFMESHIAPAYSLILSLVVFTQSIWGKAHTLYVVYVFACTLATMIWGELFVYDSLFAINNRVVPSLSLFFFLFFFYIACHCTPYWNTALLHSDLERWCDIKCSFIHSQATCCLCLVFHDILCFFCHNRCCLALACVCLPCWEQQTAAIACK